MMIGWNYVKKVALVLLLQITVYVIKQLVGKLSHPGITHTDIGQIQKHKKSCYSKISLALHRKATLHTVKGKEPVFWIILKNMLYIILHINKSADLNSGIVSRVMV